MSTGPELLLERIRAATADEYHIEREIGRGGMAAVFLGRDLALERRVAIKVMLPDLINVQGVQDRFVIEARTAAHLDHPGIVTVYAVKQRGGLLFIAMKYIEGHTLEAVLRSQGQIDPAAVALIASRVAKALEYAHDAGVVHRDVKPSNIMIDTRGRPVVTDFGIARVLTAQSITVAGSMLGTPTHMSPEQCRGLPATAASDQYSLGVTIYEMLTGRVPFTGSLFELIDAHREQAPPPLSDFVAGVDGELEQTVMRMLAKDPSARWGSLSEVVQRLSAHTNQLRGTDNFRATLVLSGGGTSLPTPEHGIPALDVLTPPDGASRGPLTPVTPVTPVSISGPPSPLPFSAPPSPTSPTSPTSPALPVPTRRTNRRPLLVGLVGSGLVALAVVAALMWRAGSEGSGTTIAPAAGPVDSVVPATPAVTPPAALLVADSIARDSAAKALAVTDSIARDSTAKAVAAKASTSKASTARELAPKAAAPRATPVKDSARAPAVRPESIAVECARLLERVSLGEKLTDAERVLLRQRCPK